MKMIMALALLAGALFAGVSVPAVAAISPSAPRDCLANQDIRAKRLSAGEGYFAQTRAGWWRNTGAACPAFARDRVLVTRSNSNRQCRGDLVEVFDAFSRIGFGGCALGGWERVEAPPARSDRPQQR